MSFPERFHEVVVCVPFYVVLVGLRQLVEISTCFVTPGVLQMCVQCGLLFMWIWWRMLDADERSLESQRLAWAYVDDIHAVVVNIQSSPAPQLFDMEASRV